MIQKVNRKPSRQSLIVKAISILLAISMLATSFPAPAVFAQTPTITPEATSNSSIPTPLDNLNTNLDFDASASGQILDEEIAPDFISDQTSFTSAVFRPLINVKRLAKSSYQSKEKIEMIVRNALASDDLAIEIKNEKSSQVNAHIEKKFVNGEYIFSINPEVGMEPGKYTIRVIDNSTGQIISEQDFTWGVLAINTNKSIYAPSETANIAIAVLNEEGRMVCDAQVNLEITAPWGQKTTLSTVDGSIIVNRECLLHQVTERPDYETTYSTSDVGRYLMTLTATTTNGTYTIKDRFEVREYVPFDVERITATRIYPPEKYPVEIKIKANESFRGKIVETVPQEFQISPGREGTISYQEESVIPESYDPKKETNIPNLPLPFTGEYPVTLGFGGQLLDATEISVYKKSGLDGHDGIDFALPEGTSVLSVDSGKVILAQENWIYGHTVVMEHSWGRSYYGHLSKIGIKEGEFVQKGTQIGLSGSTGLSTGPHLHFGLKSKVNDINNLYYGKVDPAPFLGIANEDETLSTADYPIAAKALVWNVDIEKGAEFTIGYQYKAPNKSPYFYTIGPLQFITADIRQGTEAVKFDVEANPFVLGEATPSAELKPNAESSQSQTSSEEVVFSEIRQWQIAVDDPAVTTFVFAADAQTWTYTDDHANCSGAFTSGTGNPAGSLETTGSKATGGAHSCNTYWEWSGTWENLGVTSGNDVTGIFGSYDYDVTNDSTGSSWGTGAFELRDSGATLRETMVAALTGQTGTAGWTNRFGTTQTFTSEASSTSVRLRLNTNFSLGGGTRSFTGHVDNISVTVTHQVPSSGPTNEQLMRHGKWFNNGTEQPFTF